MIAWPIVVDTNVVVAGLLTERSDSPVARILDGMQGAAFNFVLSPPLLAEYHRILLRPSVRKLHGLTNAQVETVLTDIVRHAIIIAPVVASRAAPRAPDPGDQLLWDLLATREDLLLVTGDKLLLRDLSMKGRIVSAQAIVADL